MYSLKWLWCYETKQDSFFILLGGNRAHGRLRSPPQPFRHSQGVSSCHRRPTKIRNSEEIALKSESRYGLGGWIDKLIGVLN